MFSRMFSSRLVKFDLRTLENCLGFGPISLQISVQKL